MIFTFQVSLSINIQLTWQTWEVWEVWPEDSTDSPMDFPLREKASIFTIIEEFTIKVIMKVKNRVRV